MSEKSLAIAIARDTAWVGLEGASVGIQRAMMSWMVAGIKGIRGSDEATLDQAKRARQALNVAIKAMEERQ